MAILTNVLESNLNGWDRDYVESRLTKYTDEAKKQVRDLLLSCAYFIETVNNDYATLVEYDFYGNLVSSVDIYSFDTEF